MAYRTTGAFRDQFEVLTLLSRLEEARRSEPRQQGWREGRRRRRIDELSTALSVAVTQLSLREVEQADLLPPVRELLQARSPADAQPAATPARRGLDAVLVCACAAAWAATILEVLFGGISDRGSLAFAELAALALTLAASVRRLLD